MQQADELPDLAVDGNDTARETLIAARYLRDQAVRIDQYGNIETDSEQVAIEEAIAPLNDLVSLLEDRKKREMFEQADLDAVEDSLDTIHDLTLDIRRKLDDVKDVSDAVEEPHPDIHCHADEMNSMADAAAEGLRAWRTDDDDSEEELF